MSDSTQSEREQTDESLRLERESADRALEQDLAVVDETADAVIVRARERADALLLKARATIDRAGGEPPSHALVTSRAAEDRVVQGERLAADDQLRDDRADHAAVLAREREATDRDLSEERTRADHALATRDDFMGIVSHDLLNILNAIMGVSSLIETEAAREGHAPQVIAHARRIQRSGTRMRRLVGDLVDVASIEAGMLAVTRAMGDPSAVITEAVETFQAQASASGILLRADIGPSLPPVPFDPARILQVLCNLLSNALKFTPSGGTVVVRVERAEGGLLFRVSDTGQGIPDEKLNAIFDRFVQLTKNDRRGVGLGLFISKCIVQGHGGRIWATNRPDRGSEFCFTLPAEDRTAAG